MIIAKIRYNLDIMEHFVIGYRDPLFGIIVFVLLVAMISLATYVLGRMKRAEKERKMGEFLHSFETMMISDSEFEKFLENNKASVEALALLAGAFERSGEYEKGIKVYLSLLAVTSQDVGSSLKPNLLESLGRCYFKAGFLFKAKNIFLEALSLSPHHVSTLKLLMSLYFSLGEYERGMEVLDALKEHDVDVTHEEEVFRVMMIERGAMSSEAKLALLEKMVPQSHFACRSMVKMGFETGSVKVWQKIAMMDANEIIDLLWYVPESKVDKEVVASNVALRAIMSARGIGFFEGQSGQWEIDVLNGMETAKREKLGVDLAFEYLCTSCKQMVPLAFVRCPHCSSLGYMSVQVSLCQRQGEISYE